MILVPPACAGGTLFFKTDQRITGMRAHPIEVTVLLQKTVQSVYSFYSCNHTTVKHITL